MKKLFLCLILAAAAVCPADDEADPAIGKLLNKMQLKYTVSENGNYELILFTPGNKPRLVIVESKTLLYMNTKWRQLYLTVRFKKELEKEQLEYLLSENSTRKLGAWEIPPNNKTLASFVCRIPANVSQQVLSACISYALDSAARLERAFPDQKL